MHCGFCLPACPTYTRLGDEADSPRGRLHLMRAVVEGRLDPEAEAFQTHIDRCLGCRACETVCPSGVEYGSLLELARAEAAGAKRPPWRTRWALRVLRSAGATTVATLLARGLRATGLPALAARGLPDARPLRALRLSLAMLASAGPWRMKEAGSPGWARTHTSAVDTHPHGPARSPVAEAAGDDEPQTLAVGLLEGCVQKGLFGSVNAATARVLEANGYAVRAVPGQGCCGALHAHAGDLPTARALARRNVDAFGSAGVDQVCVNAAGCGAAMKDYGHLLAHDPDYAERARAFSAAVRDASEMLAARGPRTGAPLALSVTWDAPCHLLHGQRIADAPAAVLAAVPGLSVRPLDGADECCGGAGLYGLTHPEMGGRIGRDKAEAVMRTGADMVVSANPGCMMQIGAWLRMSGGDVDTAHLVELLDESYRRAGHYVEDLTS